MNLSKLQSKQSGRSMIEMLGVLAIVGILSVVALSGYSMAMANIKAQKDIDQIRDYIFAIKELYADRNNYDDLSPAMLQDAGIFDSKNSNQYGDWKLNVYQDSGYSYPVFRVSYGIKPNDYICRKILLAGWFNEFGDKLEKIYVPNSGISLSKTYNNLDITPALATQACNDNDVTSISIWVQ
jgi:prepilin-type N-terminal cleavage/methylation domain-containing protein